MENPIHGPLTNAQNSYSVALQFVQEWKEIEGLYQQLRAKRIKRGQACPEEHQIRRTLIPGCGNQWCSLCRQYHNRYSCPQLLNAQVIPCYRCKTVGHFSPNCMAFLGRTWTIEADLIVQTNKDLLTDGGQ